MAVFEFDQQFYSLTNKLQAFAYSLTQNREDARDLFQETSFRAFKNRDKFMPGTNFKAWLMTIMKNIFINDFRRKSKYKTFVDTTNNNYFINSGVENVNKGEVNILVDELLKMVESLDDSLKVPFLMHYQGYKYKEIAEYLELPLGTIKSRIFFARRDLKGMIKRKYKNIELHELKKF